jgi:DNA-binding winged helix-turn-helix (wHTH) protein
LAALRVGPWTIEPHKSVISRENHRMRVEPKAMQVLVYLAEHAGEVVEREKILRAVWNGSKVKAEVLTNAVWELRKAFGDDPLEPDFIQTVSRKGYRLVAPVGRRERRNRAFSRVWIWLRALVRPERQW